MPSLNPPNPRPSSAHRWAGQGCTESPRIAARYPRESGPAAADGNRLHDMAAGILRGVASLPALGDQDRDVLEPYVLDVQRIRAEAGPGAALAVEQRVPWAQNAALAGTPDVVITDPARKRITISDLKTGWRPVEAFENWQLLCYAVILAPPGWTIDLRIVQPRPYHPDGPVRSWVIDSHALQPYRMRIESKLAEAIRVTTAQFVTGPACLYCDALAACPAARSITLEAAAMAGREPVDLPDDVIARELEVLREAAEIVTLRRDALEETIKARITAGQRVAGASLVPGRGGRLNWTQPAPTVVATVAMLAGRDVAKPGILTPKQAIDVGVPVEIVQSLAERSPGKTKVETNGSARAVRIFGDKTK